MDRIVKDKRPDFVILDDLDPVDETTSAADAAGFKFEWAYAMYRREGGTLSLKDWEAYEQRRADGVPDEWNEEFTGPHRREVSGLRNVGDFAYSNFDERGTT